MSDSSERYRRLVQAELEAAERDLAGALEQRKQAQARIDELESLRGELKSLLAMHDQEGVPA